MLAGVFLAFVVLLTAAIAWVSVDAARRGRYWYLWALLLSFVGLLGLIPWIIARRQTPVIPGGFSGAHLWAIRLTAPLFAMAHGILSIAVAVLLFAPVLFLHARVAGSSMAPTLVDQDRVLVNKVIYSESDPEREHVVMLQYPVNPTRMFISRVIATSGDDVVIRRGAVSVNGRARDDVHVPPEFRSFEDWGPMKVPDGYFFVMGDHRNSSSDSRHWGFVPKKYILGKVQYRWWPIDRARSF